MDKLRKLDSFHLKIIAMLTMLVDHIGAIIFPELIILRIIGRISFVIYAFLLVEAMRYSKHKYRYILILFSFEIVLSLIQYLVLQTYDSTVFALLALSATTILLLDNKKTYIKCLAAIPILYVVFATFRFTFFKVEYGVYGLTLILGFYFARKILEKHHYSLYKINVNESSSEIKATFHKNYVLICCLIILSISILSFVFSNYLTDIFNNDYLDYALQGDAILAIPFIFCYSGKRGYDNKFFRVFSYSFYPLHILILYLIRMFIQF